LKLNAFRNNFDLANRQNTIFTYLIVVDVYFNSITGTSSTPLEIKVIELNLDWLQRNDRVK